MSLTTMIDGVPHVRIGACRRGCGAEQYLPANLTDDEFWQLAEQDTAHERECSGGSEDAR